MRVKANAAHIKDTIVLVDERSLSASNKPFRFGLLFDALRMIGEEGARGLIFGLGTTNNAPSLIGNTAFTGIARQSSPAATSAKKTHCSSNAS